MPSLLNAVHWDFQHQIHGDIFSNLPPGMKTSFSVLVRDSKGFWSDYYKNLESKKWDEYDEDGELRRRLGSPHIANRSSQCEVMASRDTVTSTKRAAGDASHNLLRPDKLEFVRVCKKAQFTPILDRYS